MEVFRDGQYVAIEVCSVHNWPCNDGVMAKSLVRFSVKFAPFKPIKHHWSN